MGPGLPRTPTTGGRTTSPAASAARYPERLTAICAVNPLKEYALAEIARCAQDLGLRRGLKLHFGNSDVDLNDATHVTTLQRVFREANRHRMAIVVHIRANTSRSWGAEQARVFLKEVLPAAPDVPVQIAHLAGAGGYEDPASMPRSGHLLMQLRRGTSA